MSTFSDHNFNAALYREGRLTYGARLFDRIDFFRGGSDAAFDLAIDVGSGTGQVAHSLATRGFKKVVAIEPSAAMRASAVQHPNIKYVDSNSDHLVAEDGSADLVTVAQAIHWFDVSKFLAEAKRVLKPTGVLAIIGYGALYFQKCPEASILLRQLCRSKEKLSPYWPPSNISYVARLYTDIDSFEPLTGPVVHMLYPAPNANGHFGLEEDMYDKFVRAAVEAGKRPVKYEFLTEPLIKPEYSLEGLRKYIKSWSAYKNFTEANPDKPDIADSTVDDITVALKKASSEPLDGDTPICLQSKHTLILAKPE